MTNSKIESIIRETAPGDVHLVEPHMDVLQDFGYDSISLMELVAKLESEFGIMLPEEIFLLDDGLTVERLVQVISDR